MSFPFISELIDLLLTPFAAALLALFPASRTLIDRSRLSLPNLHQASPRMCKLSPPKHPVAHSDRCYRKAEVTTPTVSEDGSTDDGVTVHNDSPAVAHGGGSAISPTARKV